MSRSVATALCLAGVLALSACSGSEEGPKTLPPLPSKSTTPSPAPKVAPNLPVKAQQGDVNGADAFARFYFELLTDAFTRKDPTALQRYSDSGCGGCQALIGAIGKVKTPGETVEGGEYVVETTATPPLEDGTTIVEVQYRLEEIRVLDAEGVLLRTVAPSPLTNAQVRVKSLKDGWTVLGFRNVD